MSYIRAKEIPPRSGNWYDYEVVDATLTPIEASKRVVPNE